MRIRLTMKLVGCALALACASCASTATLKIRAVRLGQANDAPVAEARHDLKELCQAAIDFYDFMSQMQKSKGGLDTELVDSNKAFYQKKLQELKQPVKISVGDLQALQFLINQKLAAITDKPTKELVAMLNPADDEKEDLEVRINGLKWNLVLKQQRAEAVVERATKGYGGFKSSSEYIINPGDPDWDLAVKYEKSGSGKLVFSQVKTLAANDSVIMIVQESPGQFEPRYVSADPEEAIRNSILFANGLLRMASQIAPIVGLPIGFGGGGTGAAAGGGGTSERATESDAEAAVDALNERVDKLLGEGDLQSLLEAARGGTLSAEQKAQLAEYVMSLRSALGITESGSGG